MCNALIFSWNTLSFAARLANILCTAVARGAAPKPHCRSTKQLQKKK